MADDSKQAHQNGAAKRRHSWSPEDRPPRSWQPRLDPGSRFHSGSLPPTNRQTLMTHGAVPRPPKPRPSCVGGVSDSACAVLEVIPDHNGHEQILGTGCSERPGGGAASGHKMRLFVRRSSGQVGRAGGQGAGDYLGAISVPRAPSGCPRRYTGMPLVS